MGEEEYAVRGQECESMRGVEPMQALAGLVNSKDTIGVCSEDQAGVVQVKLELQLEFLQFFWL